MRCLSLAAALTARGARCTFAVPETGAAIIQRFANAPVDIAGAEDFDGVLRIASHRPWAAAVLDSYRVSADQEAALAHGAGMLAVIDDLAQRRHSADILLDPGYGRTAADYASTLRSDAQGLFGPKFALLRPEFARLATAPRDIAPEVRTVFVSFGLSDVARRTRQKTAIARLPRAKEAFPPLR